ncbi:PREDICTED: phosphomevalonate kinase [Gavialis gangeticus]|uniref:phosphomevalonate kinase n=1 Tax=Gavialis gangeticus TaxID=94835 RepID=UPI00092E732D|nr:PREDICTED: phosphomevalonate kinase [Gavialis gangeticus]
MGLPGRGRRARSGAGCSAMAGAPRLVLLLSGKRKSGKDFVAEQLRSRYRPGGRGHGGVEPVPARPGGIYSPHRSGTGLDVAMGTALPCPALPHPCPQVVSDTRRLSDVAWFRAAYGPAVRTVRVQASEAARTSRGWAFVAGVDDAESECGLDQGLAFDWTLHNDGDAAALERQLGAVLGAVQDQL